MTSPFWPAPADSSPRSPASPPPPPLRPRAVVWAAWALAGTAAFGVSSCAATLFAIPTARRLAADQAQDPTAGFLVAVLLSLAGLATLVAAGIVSLAARALTRGRDLRRLIWTLVVVAAVVTGLLVGLRPFARLPWHQGVTTATGALGLAGLVVAGWLASQSRAREFARAVRQHRLSAAAARRPWPGPAPSPSGPPPYGAPGPRPYAPAAPPSSDPRPTDHPSATAPRDT